MYGVNSISLSQVNYSDRNHSVNTVKNLYSKQIADSVSFTSKTGAGMFADKKFSVECSEGITNRKLSGNIDNFSFNIKHNGKVFKSDTITGDVGGKELNLKVKEGFSSDSVVGTIGEDPVNLKLSDDLFTGFKIKGNFKGKEVDIKLKDKFNGYSIEGDNIDLRIKSKTLFGNDVNVKGTYNSDPDLIPLLLDIVYMRDNEL